MIRVVIALSCISMVQAVQMFGFLRPSWWFPSTSPTNAKTSATALESPSMELAPVALPLANFLPVVQAHAAPKWHSELQAIPRQHLRQHWERRKFSSNIPEEEFSKPSHSEYSARLHQAYRTDELRINACVELEQDLVQRFGEHPHDEWFPLLLAATQRCSNIPHFIAEIKACESRDAVDIAISRATESSGTGAADGVEQFLQQQRQEQAQHTTTTKEAIRQFMHKKRYWPSTEVVNNVFEFFFELEIPDEFDTKLEELAEDNWFGTSVDDTIRDSLTARGYDVTATDVTGKIQGIATTILSRPDVLDWPENQRDEKIFPLILTNFGPVPGRSSTVPVRDVSGRSSTQRVGSQPAAGVEFGIMKLRLQQELLLDVLDQPDREDIQRQIGEFQSLDVQHSTQFWDTMTASFANIRESYFQKFIQHKDKYLGLALSTQHNCFLWSLWQGVTGVWLEDMEVQERKQIDDLMVRIKTMAVGELQNIQSTDALITPNSENIDWFLSKFLEFQEEFKSFATIDAETITRPVVVHTVNAIENDSGKSSSASIYLRENAPGVPKVILVYNERDHFSPLHKVDSDARQLAQQQIDKEKQALEILHSAWASQFARRISTRVVSGNPRRRD